MNAGRRLTALLLQAALLVLPLSGARAACSGDHAAAMDMAEMPGMTMPDDSDAGHQECPAHTAAQCEGMLVCSPVVMVVEPLLAAYSVADGKTEVADCPRDPLSVTRAPEPPPPRA